MINIKKLFQISSERFFGFHLDNDSFVFSVPKQLYPQNLEPLNQIKMLKMFLDILSKYINSKDKDVSLKFDHQILLTIDVLTGMTDLINDYIEYGEFNIYNSYYKRGLKRVNWRRTIEDKDTLIQNNMVVYNSFISKQKKIDCNDEFFILYKYALNKSFKILKDKNLKSESLNFSPGKIKSLILNFEDENFKERERGIIKSLKKIFLAPKITSNSDEMCKINYHEKFEHIWEFMIEKIIPEKNKIDKKVTSDLNGNYYSVNGDQISSGANFKPDHVIMNNMEISILDSKFYDFYNDYNSSPQTESISKQENYKKILKEKYIDCSIYNYFIFPKNNKENKTPEYFSYHKSKKNNLFLVRCVALDIESVIRHFLSNIIYVDFIKLINSTNKIKITEKFS